MVSLFSIIGSDREKTADVAKEGLQIILALERGHDSTAGPDYLPDPQRQLVAVVSRYVRIDANDIKVGFVKGKALFKCLKSRWNCQKSPD